MTKHLEVIVSQDSPHIIYRCGSINFNKKTPVAVYDATVFKKILRDKNLISKVVTVEEEPEVKELEVKEPEEPSPPKTGTKIKK